MEWLSDPTAWTALAALTAVEIVLGVDNIVFISVLVSRLPRAQRDRARVAGLTVAMVTRIALLVSLAWAMQLATPIVELLGRPISGRDVILCSGGLFLLWRGVTEIHESLEGALARASRRRHVKFLAVLAQIAALDLVFSLDSVITAVGLVDELEVMILAIVIAVGVMMFAAGPIGRFVERHPTLKMLALSFLVLIGFTLVADSLGMHIPKGYIYVAMAFSLGVELLNLRLRSRLAAPVQLRRRSAVRDTADDAS